MTPQRLLATLTAALLTTAAVTGLALAGPGLAPALAQATPGSDPNAAPGTYRPVTAQRVLDTRAGTGAAQHAVAARGTVSLSLAGRGGIPASGVSAVVLNLTVTQAAASGYVTAYPSGVTRPTASTVSFTAGDTVANLATLRLGSGGAVDLYNGTDGTVHLLADVRGYYLSGPAADPGAFTPLAPTRLLDTRSGNGAPAGAVPGRATLPLTIAGRGGVPATGVAAVVLNLTVTQEEAGGYLTAYGAATRPTASTLNFAAARSVANLATVKLGPGGAIKLYVGSSGSVQLLADVAGYYLDGTATVAGAFVPVAPARVFDSRCDVANGNCQTMHTGGYYPGFPPLTVLGRAGVPATDVAAVVLNLTATQATGSGYLAVTTSTTTPPRTSDLNFVAGRSRANQVITPVDADGGLHVYVGSSSFQDVAAVVDVVGYLRGPSLSWAPAASVDPRHGPSVRLSCPSRTFCAGLDPFGNARTFDGAAWSAPAPVPGLRAAAISCPSPTFCMVVGGPSGGFSASYDGSSWSAPKAVETGFSLSAVSCPSMTFCLALDSRGGVYTYAGSTWSARVVADATANATASGLSCPSPAFCAVSDSRGGFATFDGSTWTAAPATPAAGGVLTCLAPAFCAMASSQRVLATFDGAAWTSTTLPAYGAFATLACPSTSRCIALDQLGRSTTYDGSGWSALQAVEGPAAAAQGFRALACAAADSCVAVDASGRSTGFDGGSWSTPVLTQPDNVLSSVSCPASSPSPTPSFCLLTDADGAALTYDGNTWSAPTTVLPGHSRTQGDCASAAFCVVVDGTGHAAAFDGTGWSGPQPADPGQALTAVSCPVAGHCVAVDAAGSAVTYDGATWSAPVATGASGLGSLACPTTGFCVASDGQGRVVQLRAGQWSAPVAVADVAISQVSCASASACVAVSPQGASSFDGSRWSAASEDRLSFPQAVSCATATFCLGADSRGGTAFYGQAGWTFAPGPFFDDVPAAARVSCGSDRFCLAVNENNTVSAGTA